MVLLVFWSRERRPCVEEIPTVKRLAQSYRAAGLRVVSVHLTLDLEHPEQSTDDVGKFVDHAGIEYAVGVDQHAAAWKRSSSATSRTGC